MIRILLIVALVLVALNVYLTDKINQSNLTSKQKQTSKWLIWLLPFVAALIVLKEYNKSQK